MPAEKKPLKAALLLLLATVFWGLSFPAMKTLSQLQETLLPRGNSWFFASVSLTARFGLAAALLAAWTCPTWGKMTRLELSQGLSIGFFGSAGILLQMDGLSYTPASTSAFLTQCYCILIPVGLAIHLRRWPSRTVSVSCALVLAGVAILSQFNWSEMQLGRGEWETVLASLFFTGQILLLNRPQYAANNSARMTLVMFAATAFFLFPVAWFSADRPADLVVALNSRPALILTLLLTAFCTVGAYGIMNFWQPHISTTHAGLIYCAEPVFASGFALFLPGWFSQLAGVSYPNESLSPRLIAGGLLITAANILLLVREASQPDPIDTP